jgi:galactitol PTS system EIIA component
MAISAPALTWTPDLIARYPQVLSAKAAIRMVGAPLIIRRAVTVSHVEAAVRREAEHPTALPAEVPFALVHTDEQGALQLAAALGIFAGPVPFRRMDNPSETLKVRLVVFLSVPDRSGQAELLSQLISQLADKDIAEKLLTASSAEAAQILNG